MEAAKRGYTTLQVSAPTYWGFQHEVSNRRVQEATEAELVQEVKDMMKSFFKIHNLLELMEGVDRLDMHIHHEIVPGATVYVCSHD